MSVRALSNTTFRLGLVAVASVITVVACDTVPLTSPTGSTITLSIDRSVLPLEGQATVTAVVTESAGTAVHNGTVVTFQPSIGSVNPVEAKTVNGVATATFLAGSRSGTGFIHAFSGAARTGSGNASSGGVEVKIGAAAAGSITVSATPSSVSQSGGTVTITATVFDSASNPLPGVSVNFSTNSGSLTQSSAISDANGVARTQLQTTTTAIVTASSGTASRDVTVSVSTAPTVTIEPPSPTSPVAGQPVAITVTTSSGNSTAPRQIQTLEVNFGDGSAETRTNVTGSAAFTHTYGRDGAYTVTARAVDVAGNTGVAQRAIVVTRAVPSVSVAASPSFGTAPLNTTITTTASTAQGNPPIESVRTHIDGTLVHSSSSGGSFGYRFAAAGNYRVETVVTDIAGNQSRASTIVVVN